MSYGKKSDFEFFGKFADKVWTMIDGEFVEEWYMCCDEIAARCTDKSQQPAWVTANVPPQSPQKPPLKKGIEYPSYIYTPQNYGQSWNMNSYLRKRGLYSGEECFNQDLVQPFENITEYDLRNLEKRTDDSKKNENQNTNDKENSSIVNKINLLSISIAILLVTVFI